MPYTSITKSLSILLITLCLSACDKEPLVPRPITEYDLDESTLTSSGWTKTFSEDFDGDFSLWDIWQGGAFNNELQYYSNSNSNLEISDGALVITAKKEWKSGNTTPWDGTQKSFQFTSARIESKTNYTANSTTQKMRFAARIKLPSGYGMWPAFWSYGDNWPTNGEIDVMEARGNLPDRYVTNYFYGTSPNNNLVNGEDLTIMANKSLVDYWHVYEVIWEQNKLTYMLDGVVVDTKTGQYVSGMFNKLQRITLNLAVGGDFFGNPAPSTIETGVMYVDWVKAFTAN